MAPTKTVAFHRLDVPAFKKYKNGELQRKDHYIGGDSPERIRKKAKEKGLSSYMDMVKKRFSENPRIAREMSKAALAEVGFENGT